MPVRKPRGLIRKHETAAEKRARIEREEGMAPDREMSTRPPVVLDGHEIAQKTWRRMMRLYRSLEAQLVTRMDIDLLIDYCMLMEQVAEMDKLRRSAYQVWEYNQKRWSDLVERGDVEEIEKAAERMQEALEECVKLDGRVDRKRALLLQWRQSLYMTPRARAGAAPEKKKEEPPMDDMDKLLADVDKFLNKDDGQ